MSTECTHASVSRRSFITGAAMAGAAVAGAATVATARADEAAEETEGTAAQFSTSESWLGEPPVIDDADVESEVTVDVVVVGCGDAGSIAVRSAAEAGASVAVIEKAESNTSMGGDVALINGEVEARYGRDNMDVQEIVATHQMESSYHTKASIMERYAKEIADVFDWVCAADPDIYYAGETFEEIPEDKAGHAVTPSRYPEPDPDWDWRQDTVPTFPSTVNVELKNLLTCNLDRARETGNVQEFFGHFAEKLIMEDGRCAGVYARNAETGKYVKVTANKGVVLATGDFGRNEAMMEKFAPEVVENGIVDIWYNTDVEGNFTATGDGHRLGIWAGARMQQHCAPMIHHMGGGAGVDGRGVMGINGYLQLNRDGVRFMNEDIPGQQLENQIEKLPGRRSYQFFDSSWPEQCKYFPAAHGVVCYYSEQDETSSINQRSQANVDAAVEEGRAFKADTIDELLAQLDIDVDAAKASIEHYNELCEAGEDTDFGKNARRLFKLENAPFYAVPFEQSIMLVCTGGLESDEECHTYDQDRNVIPGLYVAGNVQGDRFAVQYPISLCGLSVGMAMFYGYVAGQNAAQGL